MPVSRLLLCNRAMSDELVFLSRQPIPPAYVIEDLGLLPDGRISHATAINQNGDVVGEADTTAGMHAFLWADGELIDLGTLGGSRSAATGINDHRQVTGMSDRQSHQSMAAFLWQDERMIDLEAHGLGPAQSANAINNNCQIAGSLSVIHSHDGDLMTPGETAFVWQPGRLIRLTDLPVRFSEAKAINETGSVAGEIYEPGIDRSQAFLWSHGHLVVLGGGLALDISDSGVAAGYAAMSESGSSACIWEENIRRDIPMPRGITISRAVAINARGDVVGAMGSSMADTVPFLWSHQHLIDLNDTIDPRSGWSLRVAADINDAGQIVGWGFRSHRHHAFRMTPNAAG